MLTYKKELNSLKNKMLKEIGESCKDYDPLCFQCEVWRDFNHLRELLQPTIFTGKKAYNKNS